MAFWIASSWSPSHRVCLCDCTIMHHHSYGFWCRMNCTCTVRCPRGSAIDNLHSASSFYSIKLRALVHIFNWHRWLYLYHYEHSSSLFFSLLLHSMHNHSKSYSIIWINNEIIQIVCIVSAITIIARHDRHHNALKTDRFHLYTRYEYIANAIHTICGGACGAAFPTFAIAFNRLIKFYYHSDFYLRFVWSVRWRWLAMTTTIWYWHCNWPLLILLLLILLLLADADLFNRFAHILSIYSYVSMMMMMTIRLSRPDTIIVVSIE